MTDPDVPGLDSSGATMPLSYWRTQIRNGSLIAVGVSAAVAVYAVTASRPSSTALVWIACAGALLCQAIAALPTDRLLLDGHGRWLFGTWSTIVVGGCVALVIIDGGTGLLAMFGTPMVYAQVAYPPRLAALISALSVVAAVATATVVVGGTPVEAIGTLTMLLVVALGGVTAAKQHWSTAARSREAVATLQAEVRIDGLTGCLTADAFRAVLADLDDTAGVAIALIDIDDFKRVNDEHGHQRGDEVLTGVGAVLRQVLRDSDLVGRVGGDEFAAVLRNIHDVDVAERVGERMDAAIRSVGVAASIGVALGGARRPSTLVLGDADALMYAAKRSAGGSVAVG